MAAAHPSRQPLLLYPLHDPSVSVTGTLKPSCVETAAAPTVIIDSTSQDQDNPVQLSRGTIQRGYTAMRNLTLFIIFSLLLFFSLGRTEQSSVESLHTLLDASVTLITSIWTLLGAIAQLTIYVQLLVWQHTPPALQPVLGFIYLLHFIFILVGRQVLHAIWNLLNR